MAAAAFTVPACASGAGSTPAGLTSITVGALPIVDDVPVYLAQQHGYFRQQVARAFQRAMAQAANLADTNRPVVEKAVVKFFHVSPQIAARVKLDEFPATPNAARIQRMADHMRSAGLLARPLNVAPLIFR